MFVITLLNLENMETFKKVFWNVKQKDLFINKCKHSKKVKLISIVDNTKLYD